MKIILFCLSFVSINPLFAQSDSLKNRKTDADNKSFLFNSETANNHLNFGFGSNLKFDNAYEFQIFSDYVHKLGQNYFGIGAGLERLSFGLDYLDILTIRMSFEGIIIDGNGQYYLDIKLGYGSRLKYHTHLVDGVGLSGGVMGRLGISYRF